jgi:hypothetical protein
VRYFERTYTQKAPDCLSKEQTVCLEDSSESFLYHLIILRDRHAIGAVIPFGVEYLRPGSCRLNLIMF